MTKVVNKRTQVEFELLSISDMGVKMKELNSGKEKMVTNEVYNRWYAVVESNEEEVPEETETISSAKECSESDIVEQEETETPEVPEKPNEDIEKVEQPKPKKEPKIKKDPKPKKEPKPHQPREISVLKDVLEKILNALEVEIFVPKVKGFRTVKVDGHMAMAYTFSTKGIVLWMRSVAVDHLQLPTTTMKHMFDRRLSLTQNTEEAVEIMRKVVAASIEYQKNRNAERVAKAQARQELLKQREVEKQERKKKDMEAKFGVKRKTNKEVQEEISTCDDVEAE